MTEAADERLGSLEGVIVVFEQDRDAVLFEEGYPVLTVLFACAEPRRFAVRRGRALHLPV